MWKFLVVLAVVCVYVNVQFMRTNADKVRTLMNSEWVYSQAEPHFNLADRTLDSLIAASMVVNALQNQGLDLEVCGLEPGAESTFSQEEESLLTESCLKYAFAVSEQMILSERFERAHHSFEQALGPYSMEGFALWYHNKHPRHKNPSSMIPVSSG